MRIDEKSTEHLGKLSCLKFSDEEKRRLTGELNSVLSMIEKLNELDVESIAGKNNEFFVVPETTGRAGM